MIFVPIGIDCEVAETLKKLNSRYCSYPFDWNVTYRGIAHIFENKFDNFIPFHRFGSCKHTKLCSVFNEYDVLFIHDDWKNNINNETQKYKRRIERLQELLSGTSTVNFIRKGHAIHHHDEYNFKDDIDVVNEFSLYLKNNYPLLKFKIYLILCCSNCYDIDVEYSSKNENVSILHCRNRSLYTCIEKIIGGVV